jgi:hypothetical protein
MVNEGSGLKVDGGEFACVQSLGKASAFFFFVSLFLSLMVCLVVRRK